VPGRRGTGICSPCRRSGRAISEVLLAALQLGLSSFGGPIAHLGYFERAFVRRRAWLGSEEFANLVAVCQVLPGPTSSQVLFLIGLRRAGWPGALGAWLGFTLPSALLLYGCALAAARARGALTLDLVHGLKLAAVAVVAQALLSMARPLCPDWPRAALALAAAALLLWAPGEPMQLAVLAGGLIAGLLLGRAGRAPPDAAAVPVAARVAWCALGVFALGLALLPALASWYGPHGYVALAALSYRAGALVFGGGHVVLPLLRDALVPQGWLSDDTFLSGYGLAQAVPGPLFSVAAYFGAANAWSLSPALAAAVALVFIFLPGLLLATAAAALWRSLARRRVLYAGLAGVNAVVVGILAAALYSPVWTSAVRSGADVLIALAGLALLSSRRVAPLIVVLGCAGAALIEGLGGGA
jgi:chromate transporter